MDIEWWIGEVTSLLRDLHVPDLGLSDGLISEGYLTSDDWNHLSHLNRSSKQVRTLVKCLLKNEDAPGAFSSLLKYMKRGHLHLIEPLEEFLALHPVELLFSVKVAQFPTEHDEREASVGDSFYRSDRSAVENEYVSRGRIVINSHVMGAPSLVASIPFSSLGENYSNGVNGYSVRQFSQTSSFSSRSTGRTKTDHNCNIYNFDTVEYPVRNEGYDDIDGPASSSVQFDACPNLGHPFPSNSQWYGDINREVHQNVPTMFEKAPHAASTTIPSASSVLFSDGQVISDTRPLPSPAVLQDYNSNITPWSESHTSTIDFVDGHISDSSVWPSLSSNSANAWTNNEYSQASCSNSKCTIRTKFQYHSHSVSCETTCMNNSSTRSTCKGVKPSRSILDESTDSEETNSEVYTSDMDEMEKNICQCLQVSLGSVSDILDDLIGDGTLSPDDWYTIHSKPVQRRKAAYLARRLSDEPETKLQSLRKALEKQRPDLAQYLDKVFPKQASCEVSDLTEETVEQTNAECDNFSERKEISCKEHCVVSGLSLGRQCAGDVSSLSNEPQLHHEKKTYFSHGIVQINGIRIEDKHSPVAMTRAQPEVIPNLPEVFDLLNERLNNGSLTLDTLPDNPNIQCIVFYLKACDSLYKSEYEDAEKSIKIAEFALESTTHPVQLRSEIFTTKTWLCLRQNKLGKMERLLSENEQYILANPTAWPEKAIGWFYYDYGRYFRAMMEWQPVIKRNSKRKSSRTTSAQCPRELLRQKAIYKLEKAVDQFQQDTSSDGPLGQGFALTLMATLQANCGEFFSTYNLPVTEEDLAKCEANLNHIERLFNNKIPPVLKASYLPARIDLHFRKGDIDTALTLCYENFALSVELQLTIEVRMTTTRRDALERLKRDQDYQRRIRVKSSQKELVASESNDSA